MQDVAYFWINMNSLYNKQALHIKNVYHKITNYKANSKTLKVTKHEKKIKRYQLTEHVKSTALFLTWYRYFPITIVGL